MEYLNVLRKCCQQICTFESSLFRPVITKTVKVIANCNYHLEIYVAYDHESQYYYSIIGTFLNQRFVFRYGCHLSCRLFINVTSAILDYDVILLLHQLIDTLKFEVY